MTRRRPRIDSVQGTLAVLGVLCVLILLVMLVYPLILTGGCAPVFPEMQLPTLGVE